jgi:hypothetical protein
MNYQIIDHGIDHEQYFQGCGIAFTPYDHVVTGIGETAQEAYDDALEQMAMMGHEHWIALPAPEERFPDTDASVESYLAYHQIEDHPDVCELHWYVSIRYKF